MQSARPGETEPSSLGVVLRRALTYAIALESGRSAGKVHRARQAMKRARAVLRLMRAATGKRAYRIANAAVRDAAQPLSPLRDAKVLLTTLSSFRADPELREAYRALHPEFRAIQRQASRQLTRQRRIIGASRSAPSRHAAAGAGCVFRTPRHEKNISVGPQSHGPGEKRWRR